MHRISPRGTLLVAVVLAAGCAGTPVGSDAPDLVLHNGRIVTVDDAFQYAEAVAIRDGRFTAVGTDHDIRRLAGPATRLLDLEGRTVVPGLMDNHLHSAGGGPGVDLSRARSLGEVLDAIAERVRETDPGEIVVTNRDWHEGQLREQRLPLRRDLDAVAPDHPVVVVRGGHEYILNSAALRKWNITTRTREPAGGRISRYPDGDLNGELIDRARMLVSLPAAPMLSLDERIKQRLDDHDRLHAAGLTTIRIPGSTPEDWALLQEMRRRGLLTMRLNFLLRERVAATVEEYLEAMSRWGVEPGEGDEWLRIGGVKLAVDGGFEGGWMRDPYAEPYGLDGTYYGLNTLAAAPYTEIVRMLNRASWRVHTHAVGDAAIDQVLDAYEAADADRPIGDRRWAIEHGFIPRDDHFPRIASLGLVVSAQNHLYVAAPSLVRYWGRDRAGWTTPVRAYLDRGIMVSGGTDSDVVPYPPVWVFYHFVTRDTISAGAIDDSQRISREEALRLLTINNAYLMFEEQDKGSIEPGKLADLVVLADDIMTVPENRIEQTAVLMTMVGGRIVHRDPTFAAHWTE